MSRLVYDYNLFSYLHNCVASVASINGKIIPLSKNRKLHALDFTLNIYQVLEVHVPASQFSDRQHVFHYQSPPPPPIIHINLCSPWSSTLWGEIFSFLESQQF